jgi:hypothetical protein
MTRETALSMLKEYCEAISKGSDVALRCGVRTPPVLADAAGMYDRFPEDGSEKKAMRWLGYMQGVLVATGVNTLEDVKEHSTRGRVEP